MTPIGWSLGGRTVAEMLALYPRSQAVRVFYEPGKGLPAAAWSDPRSPLAQLPPGVTVVVSHKDLGVDALAFVDAWLAHRPDVDLVLIAHHEPEQGKGGDPTRAEFRASWTRQRQQVGDHPARVEGRLRLAVCYTLQWIRAGGDWRLWYPEHEADAVDRVLFDSYQFEPGAPNPYRPRSYEDPESALAPMLEIAKATGKAWGIAEIDHLRITKENGFAADLDPSGELCADWYRRMHAAARAAGCQLWCHYHARHGDLTERLPEQRALRDLISQEAIVTTAPANLLAVRQLLLTHLNVDKGQVRSDDLEPAEVGIVGDPAHRGGYHCGRDRVVSGDYSVVESSRDRAGLSSYACALDVGQFEVTTPKGRFDLAHYSRWLVAQCEANTPDTRDLREVIYSPDGRTVRRWDRLGKRSSGDDSHRWHTHQSYFRDAIKAGRDQTAVIRRYFTHIGLLEDDMANFTAEHAAVLDQLAKVLPVLVEQSGYTDGRMEAVANGRTTVRKDLKGGGQPVWLVQQLQGIGAALAKLPGVIGEESTNAVELAAALASTPQAGDADEQAIIAGVLAGLPPERIADAIPPTVARQVVDELAARLGQARG